MSVIKYKGHVGNGFTKISSKENQVYNKLLKVLSTDPMFTELDYDNYYLIEEFKTDWKQNIHQELVYHIQSSEFDVSDLTIQKIVKVYKTDIANGMVFIRSYIIPKAHNQIKKVNGKVVKNDRFLMQVNLEVGVYTNDGCKSIIFEDLYCIH